MSRTSLLMIVIFASALLLNGCQHLNAIETDQMMTIEIAGMFDGPATPIKETIIGKLDTALKGKNLSKDTKEKLIEFRLVLEKRDDKLLGKIIGTAGTHRINWHILYAIFYEESRLTPNEVDDSGACQGIGQINVNAHPSARNGNAFNVSWSAKYACNLLCERGYAENMKRAISRYKGGDRNQAYVDRIIEYARWLK